MHPSAALVSCAPRVTSSAVHLGRLESARMRAYLHAKIVPDIVPHGSFQPRHVQRAPRGTRPPAGPLRSGGRRLCGLPTTSPPVTPRARSVDRKSRGAISILDPSGLLGSVSRRGRLERLSTTASSSSAAHARPAARTQAAALANAFAGIAEPSKRPNTSSHDSRRAPPSAPRRVEPSGMGTRAGGAGMPDMPGCLESGCHMHGKAGPHSRALSCLRSLLSGVRSPRCAHARSPFAVPE